MTAEGILDNAIELIKTGKKAEAQKLLEPYIEANLQDVTAWLWEVETWSSLEKKIKVLEMCLMHNPGNQQAEQAWLALNAQKAEANWSTLEKGRMESSFFPSLSERYVRLIIILETIIAAMVIAGLHSPVVFVMPYYWASFPAGLNFRSHTLYGADYQAAVNWGWVFYSAIAVLATLTKNRSFFFVIYMILIIVLMLNIKGCTEIPIDPQ